MLEAGQSASNQMAEIRGEETARGLKREQTETLLGMSQQRLGAANEARKQATESILGGVGSVVGAFSGFMDKTGAANAAQMGQAQDPSQIGLFGV